MQELVFGVLGGLALFIYGMNLMGDGLKKAAGEKMRKILEAMTKNPLIGVLVGTAVTAIIQSSSATTVMVVGFVNAGLMTLPQAIGVIMGAAIGTTMTAQLIAFDVGVYAYPTTALGLLLFFLGRRRQFKYTGQVILGFGLLFIGLNTMSGVLQPLAQSKIFADWITTLGHHRFLGVLVGLVMTMIVQSSSVTIGVLQSIAQQPHLAGGAVRALIPLPAAIPVMLGDNIGTTITALIASIGTNRAARQSAIAHTLFKVFGTIACLIFFPFFVSLVYRVSPHPNPAAGVTEALIIKRQIANAHTIFNIANTLIWLPMIGVLAWIVQRLVPGKDEAVEKGTRYLDPHMLGNAEVALGLSIKELARMGIVAQGMLNDVEKILAAQNQSLPRLEPVQEKEDVLDDLQAQIIHYLSMIVSRNTLTERQSDQLADLMHATGDMERVGDLCMNIAEIGLYKVEEKVPFSEEAYGDLRRVFSLTGEMLGLALKGLTDEDMEAARRVLELEAVMNETDKQLRKNHIERLNQGTCNPKSAVCFTDIVKNLERIADHSTNIAQAALNVRPHSLVK